MIKAYGQDDSRSFRLGINYGIGTQEFFPYNSPDYSYNIKGYRLFIGYPLGKTRILSYEFQIEPGLYKARHQLLNKYYVQPKDGADYLEQREIFSKEKIITEYVLNLGFLIRYKPKERFSFFVLGSIGPAFSDKKTERLAYGFAFTEVIAIGVAYRVGNILLDIRPGIRHISNADLKYPNSGHNSSNIDFGISIFL